MQYLIKLFLISPFFTTYQQYYRGAVRVGERSHIEIGKIYKDFSSEAKVLVFPTQNKNNKILGGAYDL